MAAIASGKVAWREVSRHTASKADRNSESIILNGSIGVLNRFSVIYAGYDG
jgi:hypothetical protein